MLDKNWRHGSIILHVEFANTLLAFCGLPSSKATKFHIFNLFMKSDLDNHGVWLRFNGKFTTILPQGTTEPMKVCRGTALVPWLEVVSIRFLDEELEYKDNTLINEFQAEENHNFDFTQLNNITINKNETNITVNKVA
jgi:hypothetical protein